MTALLTAPDISYPFRAAFRDAPNVGFRHAEVSWIDFERRVVRVRTGKSLVGRHPSHQRPGYRRAGADPGSASSHRP
ncbi:MAG: hypothetical protein ACRDNS_21380 [Trebonia sp.]